MSSLAPQLPLDRDPDPQDVQTLPIDLQSRTTSIYSQNLEVTLTCLEENLARLEAQVETDEMNLKHINAQCEELNKTAASLRSQIEALEEGKRKTVKGLDTAMVDAHKAGDEKMQSSMNSEKASSEKVEQNMNSSEKVEKNTQPSQEKEDSLMELLVEESGVDNVALSPAPGSEWKPLPAKSEELEKWLLIRQDQLQRALAEKALLAQKKTVLESNLAINKAVKTAIKEQVEILRKGRKDAIKTVFETMKAAAEAMDCGEQCNGSGAEHKKAGKGTATASKVPA